MLLVFVFAMSDPIQQLPVPGGNNAGSHSSSMVEHAKNTKEASRECGEGSKAVGEGLGALGKGTKEVMDPTISAAKETKGWCAIA